MPLLRMTEREKAAPQNGREGGRGAERQRIARSPAGDAVSRRLTEGERSPSLQACVRFL